MPTQLTPTALSTMNSAPPVGATLLDASQLIATLSTMGGSSTAGVNPIAQPIQPPATTSSHHQQHQAPAKPKNSRKSNSNNNTNNTPAVAPPPATVSSSQIIPVLSGASVPATTAAAATAINPTANLKQVITIPSIQKVGLPVPVSMPASSLGVPMAITQPSGVTVPVMAPSSILSAAAASGVSGAVSSVGAPSGMTTAGAGASSAPAAPPQIITLLKNQATIPQLPKVNAIKPLEI